MKAADCGRLAWALSVSCLTASRAAAVRSGHSLIYAPDAPVYGMTPAPALPYEARLYEADLQHWARYAAAYILMAADARARDCLRKAIADARAAESLKHALRRLLVCIEPVLVRRQGAAPLKPFSKFAPMNIRND